MRETERAITSLKTGLGPKTQSLNSCECPEQLEDEPICFYISTAGENPSRWFVLRSDDDREVAGSFGDSEEGESPITVTIENQYFLGDTENERRKSCRLTELPNFPKSLPYHNYQDYKVFAFNSRIYLIGGMIPCPDNVIFFGYTFVESVHYYDTQFPERGWKKEPDMFYIRPYLSAAESSEKIYAVGIETFSGCGSYYLGEVLDPGSDHWRLLAPLPSCLQRVGRVDVVAVLELGRKILLYSYNSQQLFYYDIERDDWSVVEENFGRWEGRITIALGCLFCFGQLNGYYDHYSLSAYDLHTGSWLPVEGLKWDGDMMPPSTSCEEEPFSSDLFCINHNKLAFVWTMALPRHNSRHHMSFHCSKFFIHKTTDCIRAHPDFCLSAHISSSELATFHPLNGRCFGSRDLDYYDEVKEARELMLEIKGRGNTVKGDALKVEEKENFCVKENEAREVMLVMERQGNIVIGDNVMDEGEESWETEEDIELMGEAHGTLHTFSATGKGKATALYKSESQETPTISTKNSITHDASKKSATQSKGKRKGNFT